MKWAGGKCALLDQLANLLPDDVRPGFPGRFLEPFVGGAAFFLWLDPRHAVLADINVDLIGLYQAVRDDLATLQRRLDEYQALPHEAEVYYQVRGLVPTDPVTRAARLVYLNRNCFNGLYRVNSKGQFNVPFGRYKAKPRLYDAQNLAAVSERLQRAQVFADSFEATLAKVEPGDFVYLDPPYEPVSRTSHFTAYSAGKFDLDDQARLRDAIADAHRRTRGRARLMLSNSSAPELVALYTSVPGFTIHHVRGSRAISAKSSGRGEVGEIVVTNY